jgi:DNA helicase HerA-like ATPase
MTYLFHRIALLLDGEPVLIPIDEGWRALLDETFRPNIEKQLRTIRSKNGAVVFITQSPRDEERLARQHGDGDFVIVEEIAAHFRLRLGPDVLDIINQGYDAIGKPAGTGTTAPTVNREVLQAKANR